MFAPVITSVWNCIRHLCLSFFFLGGGAQRWMSHCPGSVMLFSFFLLNLELYLNAKWSCTCFLFYFLPTLPFNLLSSGRFGSVSVETSKCLLERRKKMSYEIIQKWKLISQSRQSLWCDHHSSRDIWGDSGALGVFIHLYRHWTAAVHINSRGRCLFSWSEFPAVRDKRWTYGRKRGNWARCDVAQRNMAGYDGWRLGGQNSIKPYE